MAKHTEHVPGWLDMSIHDFLMELDEPPSNMAHALITCLDSCFDIPAILKKSEHLKDLKDKCHLMGKGALLTTRQLLAASRRGRLFFGFDEVWFFHDANVQPKPKGLIITGPGRIEEKLIKKYQDWMLSSGCSLGLGDGTGMNFCLRARGAARYIVRAFNGAESAASEGSRESA